MRFEKLNYSNGSKRRIFLYGLIMGVLLIVIMNLFLTKAKYQVIDSKKLASGTINYNPYDFKIMAMYIIDGENETPIDTMPGSGYTINEKRSYCTLNNKDKDNNAILKTINGNHTISNLSKNDKCYLYFDMTESTKKLIELKLTSNGEIGIISGPSCNKNENDCGSKAVINMKQNGIYEAEDDFGISYVYRGSVDNNWVVFGQDTKNNSEYIWWRIIRINGNGTLRLIYAGTSSSTTKAPETIGETTMINPHQNAGSQDYPRAVYFNQTRDDNKYVGYMYNENPSISTNLEEAHKVTKNSQNSTILDQIKYWYEQDTNLVTLENKNIDVETGFCNDATPSRINHGSNYPGTGNLGYGNIKTAYAGTDRVWQSGSTSVNTSEQTPTLKCGYSILTKNMDITIQKRDLYTGPNATSGGTKGLNGNVEGNNALPVPVGLITMDEIIYAGGFAGIANNTYWLYTNMYYWTITPTFASGASLFRINPNGDISYSGVNSTSTGARPVINLKSSVTFEDGGNGTPTNPYIVKTN